MLLINYLTVSASANKESVDFREEWAIKNLNMVLLIILMK